VIGIAGIAVILRDRKTQLTAEALRRRENPRAFTADLRGWSRIRKICTPGLGPRWKGWWVPSTRGL